LIIGEGKMLSRIALRNFKGHIFTEIDLKPITIFIGPNNSGKSSIFQLLMLFKQCLNRNVQSHVLYPYKMQRYPQGNGEPNYGPDFDNDILIDLGDDRLGLLNNILEPLHIEIEGYARLKEEKIRKIGYDVGTVKISMDFDEDLKLIGSRFSGNIDNEYQIDLNSKDVGKGDDQFRYDFPGYDIHKSLKFVSDVIRPFTGSGGGSSGKIPNPVRNKFDIVTDNLSLLFQNLVSSIHFVYGIRGFEVFCEPLAGIKMENTEYIKLPFRSQALGNISLSSGELQEKVQNWFDRILNIRIYPELYDGRNVTFKLKAKKNRLLINEGLGTQQLLHMFIPIALAEELDTITIEEPEIHLHPGTQAELMKLFLKVKKEENKQFILSTHSEHIIYPLLSAISAGDIPYSEVGIIFFHKDEKGVKVKKLDIDEKGRVRGGLPGFFEQELDEMRGFLE
jgi:hypothetical protein